MRRSTWLFSCLWLSCAAVGAPAASSLAADMDGGYVRLPKVTEVEPVFDARQVRFQEAMPPSPMGQTPPASDPIVPADRIAPPGEQQRYGEEPPEPEIRRVEQAFLRQQNVLLEEGDWQFDYGISYFTSDFDYPIVNNANIVRADLVRRQFVVPFAVRYGWTDRLQLFASIPVGWRHNEIVTSSISDPNPIELNQEDFAIGDIVLGGSYHLWYGECGSPDVIATLSTGLPTGETSLVTSTLDGGLGTGFTSLAWNLLFVHTYDPVVVYWGFGHRHYFQETIGGVQVQPGEELSYQLGVGFAVNDRVTLSTAYLGSYVTAAEFNGDVLDGSDYEPSRIRFALTALRNCRIVEPFVEVGTSNRVPLSRVGVTWTY